MACNDIIADLMAAHKPLVVNTDAFAAKVKALCVEKDNQDGYNALRAAYNASKCPAKLFALMPCCTNNMLRFNRKSEFNQTFGRGTFNETTAQKITKFSAHLHQQIHKVKFLSRSFTNIWPANVRNTFFYVDPPYSSTEANQEEYLSEYILRVDLEGSSFALSGVEGSHKGGVKSPIITRLRAARFRFIPIHGDYEKVARNRDISESSEVLVVNY